MIQALDDVSPAATPRDGAPASPHVVYLSNAHTFGGAEEYLVLLATNVHRAGWRVSVVLPDRPGLREAARGLRANGVSVMTAGIPAERDGAWAALLDPAGVPRRWKLAHILRALRPDVVHVNQATAESGRLALRAARGVPGVALVTTVHADAGPSGRRPGARREAAIDRRFRGIHAITAPAPTAARAIEHRYPHARGKTSALVPALHLERFAPQRTARWAQSFRARFGIDAEAPLVGVVGRLAREKGQLDLIQAWPGVIARVPHARLLLAGDGPDRAAIVERCRRLRLEGSVSLLGAVPHDDVPGLLAALDVVALPARAGWLPPALLEAMAAGRPVVACAAGAVPDALTDEETGLLTRPGDAFGLASAVGRLLLDREHARALGLRAQQAAGARYTPAAQVRQAQALYERALRWRGDDLGAR
jgi:phosphatidylinositol alpha-1,6-mannosyltransferase